MQIDSGEGNGSLPDLVGLGDGSAVIVMCSSLVLAGRSGPRRRLGVRSGDRRLFLVVACSFGRQRWCLALCSLLVL